MHSKTVKFSIKLEQLYQISTGCSQDIEEPCHSLTCLLCNIYDVGDKVRLKILQFFFLNLNAIISKLVVGNILVG